MGDKTRTIVFLTFLVGVAALFIEQTEYTGLGITIVVNILDVVLASLVVAEVVIGFKSTPYPFFYLKSNFFSILMAVAFIILFVYNKATLLLPADDGRIGASTVILIVRNTFLFLKIFGRFRKFSSFLKNLSAHPAQTIVLSFSIIILVGTLLMMMPFTTIDGMGLSFVESLFTITSAVCVTGLIVVDTATHFTVFGQGIILLFIQIGGLGIMLLSFFSFYVLRRSMSLEDKYLLSYMLNEDDMGVIGKAMARIIYITFGIEAAGTLLLFAGFTSHQVTAPLTTGMTLFYSLFHSVSAFCNAGFALFTASLEEFAASPILSLTVSLLIILGGLSFGVIMDAARGSNSLIRRVIKRRKAGTPHRLSLNSKIVLSSTLLFLLLGMLIFYALEHRGTLAGRPLGEQYLAAFFQSVTLRTAGFNTVPIGAIGQSATLCMLILMFIGGASGSTAGGIKVNTASVIWAYLRSHLKGEEHVLIGGYSVGDEVVFKSLLIVFLGIFAVGVGTLALTITETAGLLDILFETVSAFGTVGLSRGLTGALSDPGRFVIILLMFLGRLGPLTLLAAVSQGGKKGINISYPRADVLIG